MALLLDERTHLFFFCGNPAFCMRLNIFVSNQFILEFIGHVGGTNNTSRLAHFVSMVVCLRDMTIMTMVGINAD